MSQKSCSTTPAAVRLLFLGTGKAVAEVRGTAIFGRDALSEVAPNSPKNSASLKQSLGIPGTIVGVSRTQCSIMVTSDSTGATKAEFENLRSAKNVVSTFADRF
jgi:hypothetical protein